MAIKGWQKVGENAWKHRVTGRTVWISKKEAKAELPGYPGWSFFVGREMMYPDEKWRKSWLAGAAKFLPVAWTREDARKAAMKWMRAHPGGGF